jgi:dephospho-CoA kinase
MREFVVIGIVGLTGSGKTEVAKVASKLDIPCVRMGDVVWTEVKRRGLEVSEATVGFVANELRKHEGPEAIATLCTPLIKEQGKGKRAVVVDGIRSAAEVEEFRRAFGDRFYLIAVSASEQKRYSRIAARGRADDVESLKAFREKDLREFSWGSDKALKSADFNLINEGTLVDHRRKAAEVIKKIITGANH